MSFKGELERIKKEAALLEEKRKKPFLPSVIEVPGEVFEEIGEVIAPFHGPEKLRQRDRLLSAWIADYRLTPEQREYARMRPDGLGFLVIPERIGRPLDEVEP